MDLTGLDYLWKLITDSPNESIANLSIEYFLNMSFLFVSAKLKEDSAKLHSDFIAQCYKRLEEILLTSQELAQAVEDGHELEAASVRGERSASRALMAISISNVSALPVNIRGLRLQQTTRVLHLAERYISTIEETYPTKRRIMPHAATFHGRRVVIKILTENKKEENSIEVRNLCKTLVQELL